MKIINEKSYKLCVENRSRAFQRKRTTPHCKLFVRIILLHSLKCIQEKREKKWFSRRVHLIYYSVSVHRWWSPHILLFELAHAICSPLFGHFNNRVKPQHAHNAQQLQFIDPLISLSTASAEKRKTPIDQLPNAGALLYVKFIGFSQHTNDVTIYVSHEMTFETICCFDIRPTNWDQFLLYDTWK